MCFLQRLLQLSPDEGRSSDIRNKEMVSKVLGASGRRGSMVFFLVCFDFQLTFPIFVHVLDNFLSRASMTQFPDKSTCRLLPRLGSSNYQAVGLRRGLENSISYVDVTLYYKALLTEYMRLYTFH